MATEEMRRHDGGPLERSHLKDMVQRNALESAAYHKVAKHLENQKKAFVRQNTRDEGEMKNLLNRLQMEQQTVLHDTDTCPDSDLDDDIDEVDNAGIHPALGRLEPACLANPYPITIIPKFGTESPKKQFASGRDILHRPGSSRLKSRRKSVEYEDIQESLSSMTVSSLSAASVISEQQMSVSATNLSHDDHGSRDWLATPGAISSVRRMRKSVAEQAHHRIFRKTSTDHQDFSPSSPPSHSRNNSLKERKRSDTGDMSSPKPGHANRRGGSLKERKSSKADRADHFADQLLSRSYSVNSRSSLSDFNKKQDIPSSGPSSESIDEETKIKRKNSKKSEKQNLSRKLSQECTGSIDGSSSSRRKTNLRRKVGVAGSPDSSPVISPLARDCESFKF